MPQEPSRQIHLDFHTSEHLPGIGSHFSKHQFQEALQLGRVNLINVFAKCHHSWSYYPTKVGTPHPNLTCDLLGGQIEACHEIGVRAPIYYTMGWSAHDAETHPEWCMRTKDGKIIGAWPEDVSADDPKPTFQWKKLCPSGEYHALIMAQTEEICREYPTDGLWYDIYQAEHPCYCETCRKGMRDAGFDVEDPLAVERFRARTIQQHTEALKALILSYHPEASVYFNGLTALARPQNVRYRLFDVNTKNDLEDLPTTWGGYDKFPLRAKLFQREGKPYVAMSGKFHTAWGEFGGFKDPEAIRFEAASMVAFGAACNFGDQLHPCGQMDLSTYANIGHAYQYVEKIEEYGIGAKPVANLGLWMGQDAPADEGVARMLMEEQIDFDVVQSGDDLSAYEAIVVPSCAGLLDQDTDAIQAYLAADGKLLVLGQGALNAAGDAFALNPGAEFVGPARYDNDYTIAGPTLATDGLVASPFLNYSAALRARPTTGEVLASLREPYFTRTYGAYCGHQNTPYRLEDADHPAVLRQDNVIWFAHALDRIYYQHGAKAHRQLFANALRLLHTAPMVEAELPSCGRVSLLHQPEKRRYILHLLYASPLQRGRCLVIEDMPPLRNVEIALRLPETITSLRLVPDHTALPIGVVGGVLRTTIHAFSCHCAIVAEY
jgi:hypothetical protein